MFEVEFGVSFVVLGCFLVLLDCGKAPSWVGEGGVLVPGTAPCTAGIKRQVLVGSFSGTCQKLRRADDFG